MGFEAAAASVGWLRARGLFPPKAPDAVMYLRGHMDRLELFA